MNEDIEKNLENEITTLIYEGKRIQAIKIYRDSTSKGLKESKEYVDRLSMELYERYPDRFAVKPSASTGCMTAIVFPGLIGLAGWIFW